MHGEQNEMQRLKSALEREYENDPDTKMTVHNPKNTMSVDLYFTGEKTVKVISKVLRCTEFNLTVQIVVFYAFLLFRLLDHWRLKSLFRVNN